MDRPTEPTVEGVGSQRVGGLERVVNPGLEPGVNFCLERIVKFRVEAVVKFLWVVVVRVRARHVGLVARGHMCAAAGVQNGARVGLVGGVMALVVVAGGDG